MNEDQRAAIVAELLAVYEDRELRPWEFTVYDLMERKPGLTLSAAAMYVKQLERRGELRSRLVRHNGHRVRAYAKPEDVRPSTE